jgi:hypothetical protein
VTLLWETAEEGDFAGGNSIDAESRRPHGRAAALGAAVEANVLPRNGPADPGPDSFSGLVDKHHDGLRTCAVFARSRVADFHTCMRLGDPESGRSAG